MATQRWNIGKINDHTTHSWSNKTERMDFTRD